MIADSVHDVGHVCLTKCLAVDLYLVDGSVKYSFGLVRVVEERSFSRKSGEDILDGSSISRRLAGGNVKEDVTVGGFRRRVGLRTWRCVVEHLVFKLDVLVGVASRLFIPELFVVLKDFSLGCLIQ
jgi:hypothetical protein